ncbi:MAG TPA: hypothetical protein VN605_12060, partial [Thermoanaerobaculia bacterium]|nr:hypothetical protein [Thermoanaerobaculia bacterium]
MESRRRDVIILAAALASGAWLRFSHLGAPSFWLDEILHYDLATSAARQPWWRWLWPFEVENGPLFYASGLAGRFARDIELSARIAPALFGLAAIALTLVARRAAIFRDATVAALPLLIAASPLHVYYSREARPYALLMLLALALLVAILTEARGPTVALLLGASAWTGAASFPLLAAATFALALRRRWSLAGCGFALAAAIPLLYAGGAAPVDNASFPPFSTRLLDSVLQSFSVVAVEPPRHRAIAYWIAALAATGAVDLLRRGRRDGAAVLVFAVVPAAVSIVALWRLHHWYAPRYVTVALPGYLVLVAAGIGFAVAGLRRAAPLAGIALAVAIGACGWRSATTEPYR